MTSVYDSNHHADHQVVRTATVACEGGEGALGHPRVYLNFADKREVVCPYCSCQFVLAEGVKAGHGH
jgi:uncharacterized Zn-finger protein